MTTKQNDELKTIASQVKLFRLSSFYLQKKFGKLKTMNMLQDKLSLSYFCLEPT